jgi:hypothetical protein
MNLINLRDGATDVTLPACPAGGGTRDRSTIHESYVFLLKLFERRSGTGILPVRFNQADIFGNSRAGRPCHYFGCGYCRAKVLPGFPRFQGEFPLHRSWGEPASRRFFETKRGAAGL